MGNVQVAEFFAGIGLVRLALEKAGAEVVFANDIAPSKQALYGANFGTDEFVLRDIRDIEAGDVPTVDLVTASFPCTDLSLAGVRRGLEGEQSSVFWQLIDVLNGLEEEGRIPSVVCIENVPGLATTNEGRDLEAVISSLNALGYWCDLLVIDAKHFLPQSRERLFIVGSQRRFASMAHEDYNWTPRSERPRWVGEFVQQHPHLQMQAAHLPMLPIRSVQLSDVIETLDPSDERWWDPQKTTEVLKSMSPMQYRRLLAMSNDQDIHFVTAFRRTRSGKVLWEIRRDQLSGCLRTSGGGSSRQAVFQVGGGETRIRWMTVREYARLQGAPDFKVPGWVRSSSALSGFGDAVCVPAVTWLAENYLLPLVRGEV